MEPIPEDHAILFLEQKPPSPTLRMRILRALDSNPLVYILLVSLGILMLAFILLVILYFFEGSITHT